MRNEALPKKCADLIENGDTVFIGSGTTTDFIGDYLEGKEISIVTNSLPIFEKLKDFPNYDLILVGGRYRVKTQTFVGQFANKLLKEIKVSKAFIGVNGIDGHSVSTANEEEGNGNAIILNNAIEKYVVADNSKFDSYSFLQFLSCGRSKCHYYRLIVFQRRSKTNTACIRKSYKTKWSQKRDHFLLI